MRYIKTNEGIFSKPELPKSIIDSFVSSIKSVYPSVSVSKGKVDIERGIIERIIITTKTPVGDVDLVITLRKAPNLNKIKIISKIKSSLSDYLVETAFFINKRRETYSDMSFNKFKNSVDISSALSSIEWIVAKTSLMDKQKKETEKFYNEITLNDIKEMLGDLYDILGEYEVKKTSINGNRGYIVEFKNSKNIIHSSHKGQPMKYLIPSDNLSKVISEINVLDKRLKDLFNLRVIFDIHSSNVIILSIYRDKK